MGRLIGLEMADHDVVKGEGGREEGRPALS